MSLANLTKTFDGDIPPRSTSFTYCGVSIFRDACYQFVSAFLIIYITFAGVLSQNQTDYIAQMAAINIIIIVCRIWDGVNDPIMGWIIEKVHWKWGKYKPWIFIGGVLNTIVVLVLFLARPSGWGFVVLFGIFYFLWDIVWTINDIAYWSMLPSLTKDERRRNNITTGMQICVSIGTFAVYGAASLLPSSLTSVSTASIYSAIAVVVCVAFFLSQIVLVLVCKEHVRDDSESNENSAKLKDIFSIFIKNKQVRINIIAILLNYFAAGTLVAFATYYCYFTYEYRTSGDIVFMLTIMYAIATIIAQVAYPFMARKMTRKQLLLMSMVFIIVGYVSLFFTGVPVFGDSPLAEQGSWTIYLLYASALPLFFGQGVIAIALIVQMQSTIEYNEWKYGERKEAIVSSLRALVAKWGSALQQGALYLTLLACGLYSITSQISELENLYNSDPTIDLYGQAEAIIGEISQGQLIGLSVGMVWVPLVTLIVAICLAAFVFKIDEKMHKQICDEIDARKAASKEAV